MRSHRLSFRAPALAEGLSGIQRISQSGVRHAIKAQSEDWLASGRSPHCGSRAARNALDQRAGVLIHPVRRIKRQTLLAFMAYPVA
jgi:hypothetical protein